MLTGPSEFRPSSERIPVDVQFWMRVPLVAPEDLRDDIIENAPTPHTEEYSGEEKTWMWYVFLWLLWGGTGWGLAQSRLELGRSVRHVCLYFSVSDSG